MAIPVTIETEVYQGKSSRSANFGMEFSAKLARTLSSTLYDYKIEACIREYATNVTDSHNDSGNRGLAGKIHLPTHMEPWYEAEDFGLGMSEDTIYSIFTIYGKSSKEQDNTTNGCLGFGSKSGYSVGDSFTITSVKEGIKCVVVCYKDKAGVPTADTKSLTPTTEGNGTKIRVPTNTKDLKQWLECGARVLGAFETLHEVNTFGAFQDEYEATIALCARVRNESSVYLSSGEIGNFSHRDTRFVLMGDVLYSIPSWSDLVRCKSLATISETMTSDGIYITHFPIGAVDFAPSRESLSLDEQTFNKVSGRVTSDIIKYYRELMKEVGKEENSSWYLFYHKFKNTPVWQVLRDYQLPFTKGNKLSYTNPDAYNYFGSFDGYKIQFLSEVMKGVCGVVPAVKENSGTVFSNGVEFLHQERVARMKEVVLVYSEKEGGLPKKRDTLFNIITSFEGNSNTALYCHSEETLDFATKWFGVPEQRIVCGDKYVPVKVKKPRQKGESRGGFGTYEEHHTAAKVITASGTEFCKVDLSEEGLFYMEGNYLSVKGLSGEVHDLCCLDNAHRRFDKWNTFGVDKIIIVNKNNCDKIKRNKVKSLVSHLESLVKKKQKSMIKYKVLDDTRVYVDDKEKLIIHKVKSYKVFDRYKNSVVQDKVTEDLLKLSSFGVASSPKFKQEEDKVANIKTSVYNELRTIKEKLPLWGSVKGSELEYYLKLEKFIK